MSYRDSGSGQGPLLTGCLAALIVSLLSCALLTGLAVSPAFTTPVPPPPVSNPADRDLTVVVKEAYLQRTLIETLPAAVSEGASLEVRDDNRLVISTAFDLLIHRLEIVITIHMRAQNGELNVRIEAIEAQGYDIIDLLGVDREALGRRIDQAIQGQMEAGLGEDARILDLTMRDRQVVITARLAP